MSTPFKIQVWNVLNECPTTVKLVVYATFAPQLNEPCENDPGPIPAGIVVETIADAVIMAFDADGVNLCSTAVMG